MNRREFNKAVAGVTLGSLAPSLAMAKPKPKPQRVWIRDSGNCYWYVDIPECYGTGWKCRDVYRDERGLPRLCVLAKRKSGREEKLSMRRYNSAPFGREWDMTLYESTPIRPSA